MATQMQLKVYLEGNHVAAWTFREKKVMSFSASFLCTLTWITEKELERVIENLLEEKHGNSKRR